MERFAWRFFLVALGISWAGWIPYGAAQAGVVSFPVPHEIAMLAQYGPLVAAVWLTTRERGWRQTTHLLRRMLQWRVGLRWWVFVFLVPPAVGFAIAGIHGVFGGSTPDWANLHEWWIKRADLMRAGGYNVIDKSSVPNVGFIDWLVATTASGPWAAALVWATMAICNGGISEEPGWRGYLQPRLEAQATALKASVVTGLFWGLWHFGPDSWRLVFEGRLLLAIMLPVGTMFGTVPLAVLFACVYNNSGGSLLLPIVFHAVVNATYTFFALTWPEIPFQIRYAEFALSYALVALILVHVFGAVRLAPADRGIQRRPVHTVSQGHEPDTSEGHR